MYYLVGVTDLSQPVSAVKSSRLETNPWTVTNSPRPDYLLTFRCIVYSFRGSRLKLTPRQPSNPLLLEMYQPKKRVAVIWQFCLYNMFMSLSLVAVVCPQVQPVVWFQPDTKYTYNYETNTYGAPPTQFGYSRYKCNWKLYRTNNWIIDLVMIMVQDMLLIFLRTAE